MGKDGELTYTLKNPKISPLKKLAARAFGKFLLEENPEAGCSISIIMWFEWDNPDVVLSDDMQYYISQQIDNIMNEQDSEPEKSIDFSQSHEVQTRNNTFNSHPWWSPADFVGKSRRCSPCDTISRGERRLADSMSDKVSYEDYDFGINEFFKEFWHWNPYWIESCTIDSTWVNEM